jgi:hypothetical protein
MKNTVLFYFCLTLILLTGTLCLKQLHIKQQTARFYQNPGFRGILLNAKAEPLFFFCDSECRLLLERYHMIGEKELCPSNNLQDYYKEREFIPLLFDRKLHWQARCKDGKQ